MRLHNRQIKAAFWTDTDLLRNLKIMGRHFYLGLIQLADDSGCLEDDPLAFKVHLFAADKGINGRVLSELRDKLVDMKKLIPYEVGGKQCLFLRNFHKHQILFNPLAPDVPLPPWVKFIPSESNRRAGKYEIEECVLSEEMEKQTGCEQAVHSLHSTSTSNSNSGSSGSGRDTEPDPNIVPAGELELARKCLAVLHGVTGYPVNSTLDGKFLAALMDDFPGVDILQELKQWATRKLDQPLRPNDKPRSQIRNWIRIAAEGRYGQGHTLASRGEPDIERI